MNPRKGAGIKSGLFGKIPIRTNEGRVFINFNRYNNPGQNVGIKPALPHAGLPGQTEILHYLQRVLPHMDSRVALLLHRHNSIDSLHPK